MNYLYSLVLLLLVSVNALAQLRLPTNEAGQVQYQEIIRVPDAKTPAKKILEQFRTWTEQYYGSESAAEQQYDQEHNILFVKSSYRLNDQTVRYTLTLEAKYGRYRATLTDLIIDDNGMSVPVRATSTTIAEMEQAAGSQTKNRNVIEQTVKQQTDLYEQIDQACRNTIAHLREAMTER